MNELELYQELVSCVDPIIIVKYGNDFEFNFDDNILYIVKDFEFRLWENIASHLYVDMGFKYYNYCSLKTFIVLHELGHSMVGLDDGYKMVVDTLKTLLDEGKMSKYESCKTYLNLHTEYYATLWAYDFCKKNKQVLKRLERELNEVQR